MTLDEIRQKKAQYGYSNEQMARLSGLPLSTVQKVLGGTTKSPRYSTLLALGSVFPKEPKTDDLNDLIKPVYPICGVDPGISMVRETPVRYGGEPSAKELKEDLISSEARRQKSERYPCQGSYTLADYLSLPDDQWVELIDGIFYDMGAPTTPHQFISGEIYAVLRSFIRKKGGNCVPFISPIDVQLDCDDKTMVQPDVIVVCSHSKITAARIIGAPDLVVEVLSPGTKNKDIFIKAAKYRNAGVGECWLVDPTKEKILKYVFTSPGKDIPEGDMDMFIYGFQDKVPVSIFKEECVIDFAEIKKGYSFIK